MTSIIKFFTASLVIFSFSIASATPIQPGTALMHAATCTSDSDNKIAKIYLTEDFLQGKSTVLVGFTGTYEEAGQVDVITAWEGEVSMDDSTGEMKLTVSYDGENVASLKLDLSDNLAPKLDGTFVTPDWTLSCK